MWLLGDPLLATRRTWVSCPTFGSEEEVGNVAASKRTEYLFCPICGAPASVTWTGVMSSGYATPRREDATDFHCTGARCQLESLREHFPTRFAND